MSARRAYLVAALFVLLYLGAQLAGLGHAALTDDDDFYVPAGISYAQWLGKALRGEPVTNRGAIDAAFQVNREHPPVAKYVFGAAHAALHDRLGPTDAARVGTVAFSTLLAALLLLVSISHLGAVRGLRVGGLAVLALLTLPRFYFHSHAATLDVPVAAMYVLAAALVLRGERSTLAALGAGVAFGLATATKLNAPFLVLPTLVFVALTRGVIFRGAIPRPLRTRTTGLHLPSIPLTVLSMATVGPATFFAVWPWMWFDTVQRVQEYVGFHLHHYPIFFLYLGRVYSSEPFAPWHAPFVTTALTVPTTTLVLAGLGLVAAWPAIRLRLRFLDGPDDDHRRAGDLWLFVLLNAASTIGLVAFAGTPIYGGEKLFMPFFPFLCLLAGLGASTLYERLSDELAWSAPAIQTPVEVFTELVSQPRPRLRLLFGVLATAAAGAGFALQLRFFDVPLSSFNGLANGLRGATALGLERQYYDLAYRDLVAELSREGPPNLRVHFLPNNWEYVRTFRWYREAGELRGDITVVDDEKAADWLVVTHERRFARYGDDLARYRTAKVLREKVVDGVPLWTLIDRRASRTDP